MIKNLLLIEDEDAIRENLKINLELDDYKVVALKSGEGFSFRMLESNIDLVLLDIMLPNKSGIEICKEIREEDENIPILFLTAKNRSEDKIEGFTVGADDYVTKPFNLEELKLRIERLIKKAQIIKEKENERKDKNELVIGEMEIDFEKHTLTKENIETTLSIKEVNILKLLYENLEKIVSREELLDKVWGKNIFVSSRTVDNFILSLRKKIEPDPKNPSYILSVRGVGYKLVL